MEAKNQPEVCGFAKISTQVGKTVPQPPQNNFSQLPNFSSIVDEALYLYRANIFFRNFDLKGPADRTLLYATLFLQECLQTVAAAKPVMTRKDAEKSLLITASAPSFAIPGEDKFNLSALFPSPANEKERTELRAYLTELRVACVHGLLDRLYAENASVPDKWWTCLAKRKFMNKSL